MQIPEKSWSCGALARRAVLAASRRRRRVAALQSQGLAQRRSVCRIVRDSATELRQPEARSREMITAIRDVIREPRSLAAVALLKFSLLFARRCSLGFIAAPGTTCFCTSLRGYVCGHRNLRDGSSIALVEARPEAIDLANYSTILLHSLCFSIGPVAIISVSWTRGTCWTIANVSSYVCRSLYGSISPLRTRSEDNDTSSTF